jgi:hypothetical protein
LLLPPEDLELELELEDAFGSPLTSAAAGAAGVGSGAAGFGAAFFFFGGITTRRFAMSGRVFWTCSSSPSVIVMVDFGRK